MEPVMELKGLSKSFDDRIVLNRIDLEISRGRVVGLLGKNGAGKTTLLKCALGPLASQLPMFGILTLCIRRSRLTIVFLVVPLAAIAIVPLSLARVQWSLIATLLGGPALIWFSYRYWCRAEIGASFG